MRGRSRKLIAANESTVLAKSFLDPSVVEDGESNGCFPDPSCTNESDGLEVISEPGDFLDQVTPPKTAPWGRGR